MAVVTLHISFYTGRNNKWLARVKACCLKPAPRQTELLRLIFILILVAVLEKKIPYLTKHIAFPNEYIQARACLKTFNVALLN